MLHSTEGQLIALDWGTTSARVYLLGADGTVLDHRSEPWGILQVAERGQAASVSLQASFEQCLESLCGDWLAQYPHVPLLACGMVGSKQGWAEAAYTQTPADLHSSEMDLRTVELTNGRVLHIIPGIIDKKALPDVIRGEETQILGALHMQGAIDPDVPAEPRLMLLPGTHSKWVTLSGAIVQQFSTTMTGETFALLSNHSILAKLMEPNPEISWTAFKRGVEIARSRHGQAGIMMTAFSARTLVLTGQLEPIDILDYLSGLMIGSEIRGVFDSWTGDLPQSITICGNENLSARYKAALQIFGITNIHVLSDTASAGMWKVAHNAGLLSGQSV